MSLRRSGRASKPSGTSPVPVSLTEAASSFTPAGGETGSDDAPAAAEGRGKRKRTTTSPTLVTSGSTSTRIKLVRGAAAAASKAEADKPAEEPAAAAGGAAEKKKKGRGKAKGRGRWAKRPKKAATGAAGSPDPNDDDDEEDDADGSFEVGDQSGELGETTPAPAPAAQRRKIKGALDVVHHVHEEHEVELSQELELWLQQTEREQLQVVMRAFMPALLEARLESAEEVNGNSSTHEAPFATLAEALDGRQVKLRDIRNHVVSLRKAQQSQANSVRAPGEKASEDKVPDDKVAHEALLRAHTLLISLLDSLATTRRACDAALLASTRDALAPPAPAPAPEAAPKEEKAQQRSSTRRKVALHMTLPQGHYFTSAAFVPSGAPLDAACADVVSVVPAPPPVHTGKVPSLGERVLGGKFAEKKVDAAGATGEVHKPATHLYYNAYASFAPTHDTAGATLSLGATRLLWDNKRRVRDALRARGWGDAAPQGQAWIEEIAEPEPAPAPAPADAPAKQKQPTKLTRADFEALHPDLDGAQLAQAYEALEEEAEVDVRLRRSAQRLAALQAAQEGRLRRTFGLGGVKADGEKERDEGPDERERQLAHQVLQGLAELVQLRPKAVTLDAAGEALQLSLIPRPARLRAAAHSAAIDPALLNAAGSTTIDAGYWGTLDEGVFGPDAERRRKAIEAAAAAAPHRSVALVNAPAPAPPSVIADNEVLRLVPAAEARAHAHLSAKASLVGARSRASGKAGLLERVAETRGYTPQHAHAADVVLVRPSLPHHISNAGGAAPVTPAAAAQRNSPVLGRAAPPAQQQTQREFQAMQAALHARQAALVRPAPQQQHGHYPPNTTPQQQQRPNGQSQQQQGSQSYAGSAAGGTPRHTLGFYPSSTPARPSPQAQAQGQAAWRPPPQQPQQQQRGFPPFQPQQSYPQQQQQGVGMGMGMHLPQHPQHALWLQQQLAQQQQAAMQQQGGRR